MSRPIQCKTVVTLLLCVSVCQHAVPVPHAKTGRGRTARQSSSASTAPLTLSQPVTRTNSTASTNSDVTDPGLKYLPMHDGLGPIDEELSRPDVRRQDSTSSSTWLIPTSGSGGDFMLQLPAIDETTLHDDNVATRTLPRRAPRTAGSALAGPGSSDPQRRRGLPMSDKPPPADSWEKLNEGYKHDDDDDDDIVKTDAEAARQNAVNMFKIAMQQAEMMERDGLEASIENLPVAGSRDESPTNYWGGGISVA